MKDKLLTWNEVIDVHRSWNGISIDGGAARSILCNQHKDSAYGDCFQDDRLTYYVGPTTQSREVQALVRAFEFKKAVRVYEKVAVNQWLDHGHWLGVSVGEPNEAGFTAFKLRKVASPK